VASTCLANGAALYLCSAAVDAILFAPPFIISEQEVHELVHELVSIFAASTRQVLQEKKIMQ
jgi:adenosylmethionine-8-amino-7-oxononanoate aminotransferase